MVVLHTPKQQAAVPKFVVHVTPARVKAQAKMWIHPVVIEIAFRQIGKKTFLATEAGLALIMKTQKRIIAVVNIRGLAATAHQTINLKGLQCLKS